MSTLNMLARQPAHGLGGRQAEEGQCWLAQKKKKKSQIGGTFSTLVQFALEKKKKKKKDHLSYRWLLAIDLLP